MDPDYRRDPKGSNWCCRCQKDLKPDQPRRVVHLVCEGPYALHPDDEAAYAAAPDKQGADYGWALIGADCAKRIGLEFSLAWDDPRNPLRTAACYKSVDTRLGQF